MSRLLRPVLMAVGVSIAAPGALAQQGGPIPLAGSADGAPISRIDVVLSRDSGNPARDSAALQRLRQALAALEGRSFSRLLVETKLAGPRGRLGLGKISYDVRDGAIPGTVALRVELDMAGATSGTPPAPVGVLTGDASSFPTLYRSDRAFLTTILNGGLGVYSDHRPWFGRDAAFLRGSPIAGSLPGRRPAWFEGFVEAGLAGAAQIGDSPLYIYGAGSWIVSWSRGQDIYRGDSRTAIQMERAYGGLLYIDPETGNSFNVSAGRQNVTLNDGFLVHFVRGSANIGTRGGTYIGPRNANDFSVVVDATLGPVSFKGFYIDLNELPIIESNSKFFGANLRYAITPNFSVDASYITIPQSDSSFALPSGVRRPREGLRTTAAHARWTNAFGIEGMWLAGELARQTHESFAMSAWSGYALVGYQASWLPWSPSLSYRYAHATGDNPNTARYERFDPLLTSGLGNWLQGINFGKVTSNSNLAVHRLQFNLQPIPTLNLTFDWHILRAPERNNIGSNPVLAQLSSADIGQEFSGSVRWSINRNLFLQSIVSVAIPGKALKDAGARAPWTTLQASLYWTF